MYLFGRFWTAVAYFANLLTLSPIDAPGAQQYPISGISDIRLDNSHLHYPIFKPPDGRLRGPGSDFKCDYSNMRGWHECSTPENRECWLRHLDGREYNTHTDYENEAPTGVDRNHTLVLNDGWVNADGLGFAAAKLFNGSFPGPWIEACWGDVINNLTHNGTSVHWHGIRQNQTMHMCRVNGITYWSTTQYGSSWYHSHYSVQYADGLQGPVTIHSLASAPFDEPKFPLLMTSWGAASHNSAFDAVYGADPLQPNILLNGHGNVNNFTGKKNTSAIPPIYDLHFEKIDTSMPGRAKWYLLRLINTSFESTFIFSIDNHYLPIISADFVPIEPYYNTSVRISIGQWYHVIVEANPVAGSCRIPHSLDVYERTGIVRYNDTSTSDPTSQEWPNISKQCSDETYSSLKPILPWFVSQAVNGKDGEEFEVTLNNTAEPFPLALFSLEPGSSSGFTPLRINYNHPIFLYLNDFTGTWPKNWVAVPRNYTSTDWVYILLTNYKRNDMYRPHPIHLHGHDFAILQQVENSSYSPDKLHLKYDNPPRRDVVLLPQNGLVVIAFKTDNPGSWLMHCHIAYHATYGLALQILER
ncbi:laccase-like multicopper oxidase [Glonium stellatum]|uniref:Laccase-like multicopper oxidase n=1 Tax=Glonium stellatum TaxID=574774 RepID=A0A8E2F7G5_9PEZI|nr:laccase-like multicopper oxidase [Glonium stellatum]